jgi:hypothetical protein
VTGSGGIAFFDAANGGLLYQRSELAPVMTAFRFMFGLHIIQFQHWTLRWLYFVLGIAGCTLIGTGYLFWLESRRKRHADLGLPGVRIIEVLATGGVSGIIVATLAFFVVNRLLPLGLEGRAGFEVWTFYAAWIATFVHAGFRPGRKAWREQSWGIAALAVLAVLLNAVTTGDHLVRSLLHPHLWAIAGMDLMLLLGAMAAVYAARRLTDRPAGRVAAPPIAKGAQHG